MDLSMLDVVIGLVSMYLLLSLVCSTVVEGINHVFNRRGAAMRVQLERLMGRNTLREFCSLPGFGSLRTRGGAGPVEPVSPPAALAAGALWTRLRASSSAWIGKLLGRLRLSRAHRQFPSYIPTNTFAELALEWHQKYSRGREWCDDHEFGRMSIRLEKELGLDLATRRERIGEWFDQSMARTSGRFKARTQVIFFIVAAGLVVFANADSIRIADETYRNPAIQAAMVANANNAVAKGVSKSAEELRQSLQQFPLLGWPPEEAGAITWSCGKRDARLPWLGCANQRRVVLGWLITVLALMMGANFWFNALQKLIRIRTALKPEPEQKETQAGAPSDAAVEAAAARSAASPVAASLPLVVAPAPEKLQRTRVLAHAAAFAYAGKGAPLPALLNEAGYAFGAMIDEPSSGTQARILENASHRVLSFRGTEPSEWVDIQTDLDRKLSAIPAQVLPQGVGRVHEGFAHALASVWDELTRALDQGAALGPQGNKPILVTGHSLGGALAVLAAYALQQAQREYRIVGIVTFGQPRVGDPAFAQGCDRLFGPSYWRVVNHRDVVPRLAPRTLGYCHAGRVLYIAGDGSLTVDASSWFRLLDGIPIDAEVNWGSQVREYAADHFMAGYLKQLLPAA